MALRQIAGMYDNVWIEEVVNGALVGDDSVLVGRYAEYYKEVVDE